MGKKAKAFLIILVLMIIASGLSDAINGSQIHGGSFITIMFASILAYLVAEWGHE